MQRWLISGLEQGKYKMNVVHLMMPKKEEEKEKKDHGSMSDGHRSNLKTLPRPKLEQYKQPIT